MPLKMQAWHKGCGHGEWSRQQESNLHLSLRRTLFYPLNYGEMLEVGRDGPLWRAGL